MFYDCNKCFTILCFLRGIIKLNIHKIVIPTPYEIGDVNAFLVNGEALTIFDVGPKTTEAYEALKRGIREAGYDLSDIEQVVLTHHHPDHAGWVDAFPKANILGHEYVDHWMRKESQFIEYRNEFYRHYLKLQAVPERYIEKFIDNRREISYFGTIPLTHFINDGDQIPGHPGLKAIYTPGHAQSHFIFHDHKSNSVIGGDLLMENVAPNPLIEPPVTLNFERPKAFLQYQESLLLLKNLQVDKVYAGHGNDVTNVNELISMRIKRDQLKAQSVYEILSKPKTVMEVTSELYASIYKSQLGLTLSKTIGYLDQLENKGLIKSELNDDILIYSRT